MKSFGDLLVSLFSPKKKPEPAPPVEPKAEPRPAADPAGVEPAPPEPVHVLSDPKEMPQHGIDLIKKFEGCKLDAYQDIVGVWTIGYGSTGKDIVAGLKWNEAQAEARLKDDCKKFLEAVEHTVKVPLNSNQRGALLCFTYNLGPGALKMLVDNSSLNIQKDYLATADRMLRYNKAGGKEVRGLTKRREAERELFLRIDSIEKPSK
jgi:lysozyme